MIQEATTLEGKIELEAEDKINTMYIEINLGTATFTVMINEEIAGQYDTNTFSITVNNGGSLDIFLT